MISDINFDDRVVRSETPVLVMMWQQGCQPCDEMKAALVGVAREFPNLQFVLLNHTANPKTASQYNVAFCPTMLLFQDGKIRGRWLGATPKDKAVAWINRTLAHA